MTPEGKSHQNPLNHHFPMVFRWFSITGMALDGFPGATGPLSTPGGHQFDLLAATRGATVVAW